MEFHPAGRESEQRMSHLLARAGECAHHRASGRTPTQQAAHGERDRREREGEGAVTGHHDADAGERRKEGGKSEGGGLAAVAPGNGINKGREGGREWDRTRRGSRKQ